jgi:hypothetical protein
MAKGRYDKYLADPQSTLKSLARKLLPSSNDMQSKKRAIFFVVLGYILKVRRNANGEHCWEIQVYILPCLTIEN